MIVARVLFFLFLCVPSVLAHHPLLTNLPDDWWTSLKSAHGYCCAGPKVDALLLKDIAWGRQDKKGSHFWVEVPKTAQDMEKGRKGEPYEVERMDVPDDSVLTEPNKAGVALVWPYYGAMGRNIRCFMPGPMT